MPLPESSFCWVLDAPEKEPWFTAHVDRWARLFAPVHPVDVWIRVKWILLDKGIAATGYLQEQCRSNKGEWTTPVRTYKLLSDEDLAFEAVSVLNEAYEQLTDEWKQEALRNAHTV